MIMSQEFVFSLI